MLYDPGYCPPAGAIPYGAGAATGGAPYWTGYCISPYCPGGMLTTAGAERTESIALHFQSINSLTNDNFLYVLRSWKTYL